MANVGGFDRIVRIIIGLALISLLYFYGQTLWMWVAAAVGAVLVGTAFTGFCPIYAALGLRTNPKT